MYIFELFIKWLNKNKRGEGANPEKFYDESKIEEKDDSIGCRHNFMPVDSTGKILACTKCGFVVKKRDE